MRKFLFIFVAILTYLVLSSRSCGGPELDETTTKEAELVKTKERIKNEFETDALTRKSMRAFELNAEQKVIDLADYLHIYSDKLTDDIFKHQARQMILDLFVSDSVQITTSLSEEPGAKNLTINEFLASFPEKDYHSIAFIFDSIEIAKPLHKSGKDTYEGILAFRRQLNFCTTSDTVVSGKSAMAVDIIASKVPKAFGSDTLQVWEVFLGHIR